MTPATQLMSRRMVELAEQGKTYIEAAQIIGCSYNYVASFANLHGIKFRRKPYAGAQRGPDGRSKQMAALYQSGKTLNEIGALFGVTRERVRQIITKHHGLTAPDGGQHVIAETKRIKREASRNTACLKRWGCGWSDYVALRAMRKPTIAFAQQRRNAETRGIGWELSLWQWWSIWQQSGHWQQRGRGQGYVMCRKGDVGPYSVDNVFIATARENCSDRVGKKSGLPIGVRKNKRYAGYTAFRHINGKKLRLGSHPTPELAYAAYLSAGAKS